jgi:hypothetical protein
MLYTLRDEWMIDLHYLHSYETVLRVHIIFTIPCYEPRPGKSAVVSSIEASNIACCDLNICSIHQVDTVYSFARLAERSCINKFGLSKYQNTQCWCSVYFIRPLVLRKTVNNQSIHISNINTCNNSFPSCGPTWPPEPMIWTNFNLLYVSKLPYKFQLSWSKGYWEDF